MRSGKPATTSHNRPEASPPLCPPSPPRRLNITFDAQAAPAKRDKQGNCPKMHILFENREWGSHCKCTTIRSIHSAERLKSQIQTQVTLPGITSCLFGPQKGQETRTAGTSTYGSPAPDALRRQKNHRLAFEL